MTKTNNTLNCSVGIFIHNEANNIGMLLNALNNQILESVAITQIVVVSSASTDGSDDIVREYAKKDERIELITEDERRGKSAAINLFLAVAKEDIVIISSGDIVPAERTIEKVISPFKDESIGMTGGRPVPVNKQDTYCGYLVHLQWRIHHRIALHSPKLGEMVAFRKVITEIPKDSAVDEASIEAAITSRGLKLLYVADATVFNKGPETLSDFIKQRRRIAAGHLWLKKRDKYLVSTNEPGIQIAAFKTELLKAPLKAFHLIFAVILELYCRGLGWYDLTIKKKNPYKWDIATSTKTLQEQGEIKSEE